MNEISIFIDESGDFGEYQYYSPYYIISLVFHEQKNNINPLINHLDTTFAKIGYDKKWVHIGPMVRHEDDYKYMSIPERRKILNTFSAFIRKCPITYKCFCAEKKHIIDEVEIISKLTKQISSFIKEKLLYFNSFDTIKIYYDNGQIEVTKMLSGIFNTIFSNVIFYKVIPSQYKLFQAADLFCYFQLLSLKLKNNTISENEIKFFDKTNNINKYYLKPLSKLEFK